MVLTPLPDKERTSMVIPVSTKTFFNTNWKSSETPLCAYDMVFHPPDYDPKSAGGRDPNITKRNIWDQERHKPISSTNHFMYGRPYRKILDKPTKLHVRVQVKNENPHMRLFNVLEWAVLLVDGKELPCN